MTLHEVIGSRRTAKLRPNDLKTFRARVLRWYEKNARSFPWRETLDPYRITVSEIMLQQTQTYRVAPFYERFLRRFPRIETLARASTVEVLREWRGLGYNRRASALRELARIVCDKFGGCIPDDPEELRELPGIGSYTAAAIGTFAFGKANVFIETNIRTVFLHEFFAGSAKVSDDELTPLVAASLHRRDPRRWYWALMDYGAALKKSARGVNARSAHYRKQSPFKGSFREIRGCIVRRLVEGKSLAPGEICRELGREKDEVARALKVMREEGLIGREGRATRSP